MHHALALLMLSPTRCLLFFYVAFLYLYWNLNTLSAAGNAECLKTLVCYCGFCDAADNCSRLFSNNIAFEMFCHFLPCVFGQWGGGRRGYYCSPNQEQSTIQSCLWSHNEVRVYCTLCKQWQYHNNNFFAPSPATQVSLGSFKALLALLMLSQTNSGHQPYVWTSSLISAGFISNQNLRHPMIIKKKKMTPISRLLLDCQVGKIIIGAKIFSKRVYYALYIYTHTQNWRVYQFSIP